MLARSGITKFRKPMRGEFEAAKTQTITWPTNECFLLASNTHDSKLCASVQWNIPVESKRSLTGARIGFSSPPSLPSVCWSPTCFILCLFNLMNQYVSMTFIISFVYSSSSSSSGLLLLSTTAIDCRRSLFIVLLNMFRAFLD